MMFGWFNVSIMKAALKYPALLLPLLLLVLAAPAFSYDAFVDPSGKMELPEVMQQEFISHPENRYAFGYNESSVWIRTTLANPTDEPRTHFVRITPNYLQHVDGFIWERSQDHAVSLKPINTHTFMVHMEAHREVVLYFRIISNSNKTIILKQLDTLPEYLNLYEQETVMVNLLLITIVILLFYALTIYIFMREKAYLLYMGYLISLLIYQGAAFRPDLMASMGLSAQFLPVVSIGIAGTLSFMMLFVSHVLALATHQRWLYRLFWVFIGLIWVGTLYALGVDYTDGARFRAVVLVPLMLLLVFIAILANFRREPVVRYFFVGWLCLLAGLSLRTLAYRGVLPSSQFTELAFPMGIMIEALLFLVALAHRLKLTHEAQIEALKDSAQKERILFSHSRFALAGQLMFNIDHQWKKPLNHIAAITTRLKAKLYQKQPISSEEITHSVERIDHTLENLRQTMQDLRQLYAPDQKFQNAQMHTLLNEAYSYFQESGPIHPELSLEIAGPDLTIHTYPNDWRHILLNLLQNSLDAARSRQYSAIGILIEVFKTDRHYGLIYRDDAGGTENADRLFEPFFSTKESMGSGIGLYLVQQIITGRLGGEVRAENFDEGLAITIQVPHHA